MNYTNDNILEHEPLRRVVNALYDEDISRDELMESLRLHGYDPDALIASVKKDVMDALRNERLAWQDAAKRKLVTLRGLRENMTEWTAKTKSEIEDAFSKVVAGTFGKDAKLKVQAAFRNLNQVSTEDKASFLNDLEALNKLSENNVESKDK